MDRSKKVNLRVLNLNLNFFFTQDVNLNTNFHKAILKFDDMNLKDSLFFKRVKK